MHNKIQEEMQSNAVLMVSGRRSARQGVGASV